MGVQATGRSAAGIGPIAPVFFDRTGKRWRRILVGVVLAVLAVTAVIAALMPDAVRPLWTVPLHQASGYPAQVLTGGDPHTMPVLGDENSDVLARVDLVRRRAGRTYLTDPFSGRVIRAATADEAEAIGTRPYVLEWYGHPARHQLVLTFDDGPGPQDTPEILNILSRAHVPATFFLIGENVVRYPALVSREIREGHVAGNHTLTHTGAGHGSALDREELIGEDRIIRASAAYATRLFRMPYGDPDSNPLAVLEAQQLGYTVVNYDLDTNDWQYTPGQAVPLPKLDGNGHVVLLHDGGADRAATVRLLPQLIAEAKADGYTFTTVASLVPAEYAPAHVTPSLADRVTWYCAWTIIVLPAELISWLFWFGVGSLTIMSLIYIVLALVSRHRQDARHWAQPPGAPVLVSVALPAYNEEKVLAKTLTALARTDYPVFEVVAVDDGSTDDTWGVLTGFASRWPWLRIFRQETNRGKAAALNYAIAQASGEIIVTLDGDTVFEPPAIGKLARHFADPRLGVVAGQVKVGNRRNILTAWQSLEYISGICVTRMVEGLVGAITIAPGACAAWRKRVILEAGGYSSQTLAEDCDLTLGIQRLGYKVTQDNEAIAWTEAPMTVRALAKQRLRWTFGNLQAFRKHRGILLRPRYGMLGMVVLPYALLSILIPLIFMPLTYVAAGLSIASGRWQFVALFAAFVAGIHLIQSVVAIWMVRERPWHLLVVPTYRLIYEPLRFYVLYRSLVLAAKGKAMGWYRPARTNTVGQVQPAGHDNRPTAPSAEVQGSYAEPDQYLTARPELRQRQPRATPGNRTGGAPDAMRLRAAAAGRVEGERAAHDSTANGVARDGNAANGRPATTSVTAANDSAADGATADGATAYGTAAQGSAANRRAPGGTTSPAPLARPTAKHAAVPGPAAAPEAAGTTAGPAGVPFRDQAPGEPVQADGTADDFPQDGPGDTAAVSAGSGRWPGPVATEPDVRPQPQKPRRRVRTRLVAAGLAIILIGSLATAAARHLARPSAAAVRAQAAVWVAEQVSPDVTVSCDAVMCAALKAHGFPAGKLVVLGPASPDPVPSAVVVETAAVHELFGSSLALAWAPAVLASFGSGTGAITVRAVAPHGAAAYQASLHADLAGRQASGAALLRDSRITVSATARSQLMAGQVDSRLLLALASAARHQPIDIIRFGNLGQGASPGVPLRFADLAANVPAAHMDEPVYVRAVWAALSRPGAPARPARAVWGPVQGQAVLRVEFTAPSPLGKPALGSS